jgi:D-lactate dehydrogenase
MKAIFFEWDEYEQFVADKYSILMPQDIIRTPKKFDVNYVRDVDCISIKSFSHIDRDALTHLKRRGCNTILLRIAGFNNVDVNYAHALGIRVFRVADYSPESIAEFVMMMMLSLARKYNKNYTNLQLGIHERKIDQMGFLLRGKVLGLHGYGKIAQQVANIARNGFGMKVQFYDKYIFKSDCDTSVDSLSKLYSTSNIISIHIPLTEETRGIVNTELLSQVPPNFMLINTARGGIVSSADVKQLHKQGKIRYLGVDVWNENDEFDHEIIGDNAFQSYHVAFFTEEAVKAMIEQTLESYVDKPRKENILP